MSELTWSNVSETGVSKPLYWMNTYRKHKGKTTLVSRESIEAVEFVEWLRSHCSDPHSKAWADLAEAGKGYNLPDINAALKKTEKRKR